MYIDWHESILYLENHTTPEHLLVHNKYKVTSHEDQLAGHKYKMTSYDDQLAGDKHKMTSDEDQLAGDKHTVNMLMLAPHAAKSFLKVRRKRWTPKRLWGEEQEEEEYESYIEYHEDKSETARLNRYVLNSRNP